MEKIEFQISRTAIILGLALHFIIAVYFGFFYFITAVIWGTWAVIIFALFMITWVVCLLKRPHKIVIDKNEIVFIPFLFNPKHIDVDKISSIVIGGAGGYARFKSEKKTLATLSRIKNREDMLSYIRSLNPNIEIKQTPGIQKATSAFVRIIAVVMAICIVSLFVFALFFSGR
jgi:Ca2+/Na+ antiporter